LDWMEQTRKEFESRLQQGVVGGAPPPAAGSGGVAALQSTLQQLNSEVAGLRDTVKALANARKSQPPGPKPSPYHLPGTSGSRYVERKMDVARDRMKDKEVRQIGEALAEFREQFELLKSSQHLPDHQSAQMDRLYRQLTSKAGDLLGRLDPAGGDVWIPDKRPPLPTPPARGWAQLLGFDRMEANALKAAFRSESWRGRLQRHEFEGVMKRLMGLAESSESRAALDALFNALDSDQNGSLDWREFYTGLTMLCRGTVEERLEVAFHMFDRDGNGYIEERELQTLMRRLAGVGRQRQVEGVVQQVLRDADWSGDRRLSWHEFRRSALAAGVLDWMEQTRKEFESRLQEVALRDVEVRRY